MSSPPRATIHLRDLRQRAFKRLVIGGLIAAVWIAVVLFVLRRQGFILWGPALGAPTVPLLMSVTELITGRSFRELSQQWDELKPWQRGVFGFVIVAIALAVILALASLVIMAMVG